MKKIIPCLIGLTLFSVSFVHAQTKSPKNELGIFGEISPNGSVGHDFFEGNSTAATGFQFKRWNKHANRANRVSLSFQNNYSNYFRDSAIVNNIFYRPFREETTNSFNLLVGREWHRQFFKKVYFYAYYDVGAGVASSKWTNGTNIKTLKTDSIRYTSTKGMSGNYFGAQIISKPGVGAKINGKHLVLGMDISFQPYIQFSGSSAFLEASANNIMQRLYLGYKF